MTAHSGRDRRAFVVRHRLGEDGCQNEEKEHGADNPFRRVRKRPHDIDHMGDLFPNPLDGGRWEMFSAVALARDLEPFEQRAAKARLKEAGRLGGKGRGSAKLAEASTGERRDKIAVAVGIARRTLDKAESRKAQSNAERAKLAPTTHAGARRRELRPIPLGSQTGY
jgi:hypothetical protein